MKKSKILAISLGSVALATLAISTPVVLTSCTSNSEPVELVKKDFITLNSQKEGLELKRIENTNNWEFYVGENKLKKEQYFDNIKIKDNLTVKDIFDNTQLTKIGFDIKKPLTLKDYVTDYNGKEMIQGEIIDAAADKKRVTINHHYQIIGKTKEDIDHSYKVVVSLTMIAN